MRCGWHVVDRGWLRCGPSITSVPRVNEKTFKAITNQVKTWLHVLCSVDTKYSGVSHHDVLAVTWWKEFLKYGFSNHPDHQHIAGLHTTLLLDVIKGPSLPISSVLPPVIISTITDPLVTKPPKEACLNYDTYSITYTLR